MRSPRRPPGGTPGTPPVDIAPVRHRRPVLAAGRHRRLPSWLPTDAGRWGVAVLLLAAAGLASVADRTTFTSPVPADPAAALAAREEAAAAPDRSTSREQPARGDQAPVPRAAAPDASPPPPPPAEPEPPAEEPATEPAEEPAEEKPAKPEPAAEERPPDPVGGLDRQQMAHAATIVRVGQELGLPKRAYVVALATAMQESTMRVLASTAVPKSLSRPHDGVGSDHDSVGLFQQRPSMGWGTVADCMDPEISARTFYVALRQVPGWQDLPVTVAAQTVQVSAFPDHYAKHEPLARKLVAALTQPR